MKKITLEKIFKSKVFKIISAIFIVIYILFVITPLGQNFFKDVYGLLNLEDNKRFSEKYDFSIEFLEAGKSDIALIRADNKLILIDTSDKTFSESIALKFEAEEVTVIDAIFISHFDSDHAGGLIDILNNYEVKKVYLPCYYNENEYYAKSIHKYLNENKVTYEYLKAGDKRSIDFIDFEILAPVIRHKESNNNSLVFMVNAGKFSALFTGDMELKEINDILENKSLYDCDLIKISHHGSINGTNEELLNKFTPEYGVISVGRNSSGLPNRATLSLLSDKGIKVLRTDKQGDIIICTNNDDENIYIKTEK